MIFWQFRDTFPSLFLEEPEKREYAIRHFLMTLHQMARQSAHRQHKGSSSRASQISTASGVVTRRADDRLASGQDTVLEITDNEDEEDEDDELDQLVCFLGGLVHYLRY